MRALIRRHAVLITGTRLLASLLVSPATMWLLLAAVGLASLRSDFAGPSQSTRYRASGV